MTNLLTLLSLWALALVSLARGAEPVPRATFTEVTNYGTNPTGTRMWLYVPKNLAPNPAVVVGVHWCSGSAQAFYQGSQWARYSETYGFVVIYPQTPYTRDNCWDVASKMTLTHGGGGASNSIVNMVDFVAKQYAADRGRVYVTGVSSGAMMTVCSPLLPEGHRVSKRWLRKGSGILTHKHLERPRRNIPRRLRSRHSLRGRPRGLLHERRRHPRLLELDLLHGPVRRDAAAVGQRREKHVPGLHGSQAKDADLPRECRPDA